MADKKESLHDANKKSEALHETHEPTHSDGLHETHADKHGGDMHENAKAESVAKKTGDENEAEADAEAPALDRRSLHHGAAGVPNDYPGGNPGNADNDRMHQAHAERAGHMMDNESDEAFMAKPHHVLPKDATGLPDDEDVDLVGPAVHGPNDVQPKTAEEDEEDK